MVDILQSNERQEAKEAKEPEQDPETGPHKPRVNAKARKDLVPRRNWAIVADDGGIDVGERDGSMVIGARKVEPFDLVDDQRL